MKYSLPKTKTVEKYRELSKRAQQLSEQVEKTTKIFNPTNFINANKNIDIQKLKQKIQQAKQKLTKQKQTKQRTSISSYLHNTNQYNTNQLKKLTKDKIYIDDNYKQPNNSESQSNYKAYYQKSKKDYEEFWKNKNNGYVQVPINKNNRKIKSQVSRGKTDFVSHKKSLSHKTDSVQEQLLLPTCRLIKLNNIYKQKIRNRNSKSSFENQKQRRRRLATDLGEYQIHNQRKSLKTQNSQNISRITDYHFRKNGQCETTNLHKNQVSQRQNSYRNIELSQFSVQLKSSRKILISEPSKLKQFQLKIILLWQLYQQICAITEQIGKSGLIGEHTIIKYIDLVTKQKYQFIYELCQFFCLHRIQRTIKLSRVLEYFSIFELCLNGIQKKKLRQAQIVNFLGYSSSSILFIIKLFYLCYETPLIMSKNIQDIKINILEFQEKQFKQHLRNPRDILRRIQHNNQIIQMLKIRCGRKHGKYCQQFISQTIKNCEKSNVPFYEIANNIFQFLTFYLHYENYAYKLPLLSYPPAPFLSLKYSKSIVIQPWGVLAFRKNDKLVIRAHTSSFLSKIMNTTYNIGNASSLNTIPQTSINDSTTNFANLLTIEQTIENSKVADKDSKNKFNLIFWTQLMPRQADFLAQILPQGQNIYWLYRYHCLHQYTPKNNNRVSKSRVNNQKNENPPYNCIKNLDHLGTMSDNTIIIDNNQESYRYHADNGINLKWKGQKKDTKLLKLWQIINSMTLASDDKHTNLKKQMMQRRQQIDEIENQGKIKKFKRNNNRFIHNY